MEEKMKVDVSVINPFRRRIRVEVPAAVVNKEFSEAYESVGRRARIKGFRPGKAPRSVLQGLYRDEVRGQVLSRLVERSLHQVFQEQGLNVVSRPEVDTDNLEEGTDFGFSALVEVKPEIQVNHYIGRELEKVKAQIDDNQVEATLHQLQESYAQLEPVEDRDIVAPGDFVVVDFTGSIDGQPFPGGRTENYLLQVGSGKALPEFEEAIIGLRRNGEHPVRVSYPEDHPNRDLAGKTVVFSVVIREIKKKTLPPLDDEFAKDHGEYNSLDELRKKIRSQLEGELQQIQTTALKEQLLGQLIDSHPFEVPPSMVERQMHHLIQRHESRLGAQGAAAQSRKPSLEELRKDLHPQAVRQIKAMLLLEKIAELERIQVSEEEVKARIDRLVRSAGEKGAAVREFYGGADARDDLQSQMIYERTLDYLFQHASIREIEPPVDAGEKKS
ncbi:MAG: trigger factor [Deltaproteobacteria bacterium]|nr:trigger factor [Deltaproteobacteria bacterium]